jgi:hypothetical protein
MSQIMKDTIVSASYARNGPSGECFFCKEAAGSPHTSDCMIPKKPIRLRVTLEFDTWEPAIWDDDMILFHRNESSWCADNFVAELSDAVASTDECFCKDARFEIVKLDG